MTARPLSRSVFCAALVVLAFALYVLPQVAALVLAEVLR